MNQLLTGFHRHHIIPKCMGGTNAPENLVLLHPIDHAIAHLVRYKMFGHPADGWAFNRVINGLKDELIPNRKGIPKPYLRKPKSAETKAKMSAAAKGRKRSPETIEKLRKAFIGRKPTKKQLECLAIGRVRPEGYVNPLKGKKRETPWMIGRPCTLSKESCIAGGKALKGKKQTPEQIAKRVASRRATLASQGRTQ